MNKMGELNVSVIRLEPMWVASFFGFGTEPEMEAWGKLIEWAQPLGLLDHPDQHRIFGFNHPEPAPGSPNYGYELWLTVDPNYASQGKIELKEFPGGLYAVARCAVNGNPYEAIPAAWQGLVQWREQSRFKSSHHQWLEAFVETSRMAEGFFTLDLYLPLTE
jgi:DNA gyrase inhibitor GyrI